MAKDARVTNRQRRPSVAAAARQAEHDRRMKALDEAIREYEAEHGVITEEEIREATRHFRARAIAIRPPAGDHRRKSPRRGR